MRANFFFVLLALFFLFGGPVRSQVHTSATDSTILHDLQPKLDTAYTKQDFQQAASILQQMIAAGAHDSDSYHQLALMLALSGNKEEGKKYLDTAIRLGWNISSDGGATALLFNLRFASLDSATKYPTELFARIKKESARGARSMPQGYKNMQLYRMYFEDQQERIPAMQMMQTNSLDSNLKYLKLLVKEDSLRRTSIYRLLARKSITTPKDLQEAALILQHGHTTTDYWTAHELALRSVHSGNADAKWLTAATLDRYLMSKGEPQKYGTQSITNEKTGKLELYKVDPTVTDSERAKWNVPPLKNAMNLYNK